MFDVRYKETGPPAPEDGIHRLEALVGRSLPVEYRSYLAAQDGGWLEDNSFSTEDNSYSVDEIFGVREDAPYSANIWKMIQVFNGRLPAWMLPVASDAGGNLYALSMRDTDFGSVWFWDHEEEEPEAGEEELILELGIAKVAEDWSSFLGGLQPITHE
ncbi:SMI1/KNR4 family protein [Dactylosporangium sp. NPDC000521]|uniref:SMI1/KNR4 family protein n=1 Tax=Dactylosporangium sp. NPDC000521 TaxID=3363975 RepID=UPI0036A47E40